ncbi:MAG: AMP-binding protein, partial [Burkholderiaceae bacterium]
MLEGIVPWPETFATRYREAGLWEDITVTDMVERTARRIPEHVAVVAGERRITYAALMSDVKRLAFALHARGVSAGDRVVVQLPNIPEFVTVYLALNRIGAIPVLALRAHRHAEVRHFIRASGAVAYVIADVVGDFDYRMMAAQMVAEFPTLAHVIVAGVAHAGQVALQDLLETNREGEDEAAASRRKIRVDPM